MKVGFTGTQKGMSKEQRRALAQTFKELYIDNDFDEFHHGDCIGADEEAHDLVRELFCGDALVPNGNVEIIIHPPIVYSKRACCDGDDILEPKPYLERNHGIVDATEMLIACPKEYEEQLRSGTWATVRYARKRGKWIVVVFPDGTVKDEPAKLRPKGFSDG